MTGQGRLFWRCRRGMRELDTLLEQYLAERYPVASADEQIAFESVLEFTDPRLWSCLLGQESPQDPVVRRVIHDIARYRH